MGPSAVRDQWSRFAGVSRPVAIAVLAALAVLIALGVEFPATAPPPGATSRFDDIALYNAVIDRMRKGEPYEMAAIAEQRVRHYPVRPFLTVRPPALALALARLPDRRTGETILLVLTLTVIGTWALRLQTIRQGPVWLGASALIMFTGVGMSMAGGGASLFHEAWAGLLMALSLAVRTDKRFWLAVVLGLLAALIREQAMPYLVVMALIALTERRRVEAVAFAAALALALAALAAHAHAVMAIVTSHDPASPGWVKLGGWRFVLATAKANLTTLIVGPWITTVLVPLALLGALGRTDGLGRRLAVLLAGYTLGFMAFGRPENYYWGLATAPLTAVGLCLAPLALADLARQATGRSPTAPNP